MLRSVLEAIKPIFSEQVHMERFHDDGGGADKSYNVYKITENNKRYVLKKSDDSEIGVYEKFLAGKSLPVPNFQGLTSINNTKWILIEYIAGTDLPLLIMFSWTDSYYAHVRYAMEISCNVMQ